MGKRPRLYLWALAQVWKLSYIKPSVPVIGKFVLNTRHKLSTPENFNISHLPINAVLTSTSTPLPVLILEDIIRSSPYRTIIHRCTCREARHCSSHDMHIGCMHIGEATMEEDINVARHVSVEEAIDHLHKAVDSGLIPFMGHAAGDNLIWNVSRNRPFLTVCFCCPCCCTLFNGYKYMHTEAQESFHRLKGVFVSVNEDICTGCGKCVEECFTSAIYIQDGKAYHHDTLCKACGHCANVCDQSAITVRVENLDATLQELLNRIDKEVGGLPTQ